MNRKFDIESSLVDIVKKIKFLKTRRALSRAALERASLIDWLKVHNVNSS